jgi:superfamily II DNA or RNA helicase
MSGKEISLRELQEKYQALLAENGRLREELGLLKARLELETSSFLPDRVSEDVSGADATSTGRTIELAFTSEITTKSDAAEKIRLFMSLFSGRDDVYARRWENKKKGTSGYSPYCFHEWERGLCSKPKGKCSDCRNKAYATFDEKVVEDHLRGNIVAGVYPMLPDETCRFLAIDLDDGEWRKDAAALRETASEYAIPLAVERSRSGKGAHVWFFFETPLAAVIARKFGTALLTHTMSKRHEITFKSYDRFFPNQDTMPAGGLGNLIALPLQKEARTSQNSEFIDEHFQPYADQWSYLGAIRKLTEEDAVSLTATLCRGSELGVLKIDEEDPQKPWETVAVKLLPSDFPRAAEIVKANMLYIPKAGISQRGLNRIRRLAAFKNPEFYKAQAMRFPTYDKPRVICCADATSEYLCLPRGCGEELNKVLTEHGVAAAWVDKTNRGRKIDVEFKGVLRDEQTQALEKLLAHDTGVLSGTTAFGKTVVAIRLIAERKVNTLIIVNRAGLIGQWRKRLQEFLTIDETAPTPEMGRRGRKRKKEMSIIGQMGQGKQALNGIIDIALMQSLGRMGEVRECVKNYGMVIVDECHHVAALSLESILKIVSAKYVYGLTATPARKDGHHPIIFMQCGPVRFRDDARKQAEKRPFEHFVIPRFTPLRPPLDKEGKELAIQALYAELSVNELRNQLIIDDVVKSHEKGRNCLVLTERTAHVEYLADKLREKIPDALSLVGSMGAKETGAVLNRIAATPADRQLTLIATGRYLGEGFDEPRLDTLFLTMPISWKGTVQQYAGRLHRLFENKKEVQIYDYVDIHVKMLEKMYQRRLNGYAAIGYKMKAGPVETDSIDIIFDKGSFLLVYSNDIAAAKREIVIVSPFVTRRRTVRMLPLLETAVKNGVKTIIVTRPPEDFKQKDAAALQETLNLLNNAGVRRVFRSNIHQKFAVIDQRIVWYGSINLMSYGDAEESIMRLESPNIANELIKVAERTTRS